MRLSGEYGSASGPHKDDDSLPDLRTFQPEGLTQVVRGSLVRKNFRIATQADRDAQPPPSEEDLELIQWYQENSEPKNATSLTSTDDADLEGDDEFIQPHVELSLHLIGYDEAAGTWKSHDYAQDSNGLIIYDGILGIHETYEDALEDLKLFEDNYIEAHMYKVPSLSEGGALAVDIAIVDNKFPGHFTQIAGFSPDSGLQPK